MTTMPPTERARLSVVRPRIRSVGPVGDRWAEPDRGSDEVDSFVDLVRMLLPVSSLSAQRAAAVRHDLRLLVHEARRDSARTAVCAALMASVVDQLADGVSAFSLRSLQARARLAGEPEPA